MSSENAQIPKNLPLLFIPGGVVLPGVSVRFKITSARGIALIKSRLLNRSTLASTIIGVVPIEPTSSRPNNPMEDENFQDKIGTATVVVQIAGTTWPRQQYSILVTGIARFKILDIIQDEPFAIGQVEQLTRDFYDSVEPEENVRDNREDISEIIESFRAKAINLLELLDLSIPTVAKLRKMLESAPSHQLADIISAIVNATFKEKLDVLNSVNLKDRFLKAFPLLLRQIEGLKMLQEKQENDVRNKINPNKPIAKIKSMPAKTKKSDMLDDDDSDNELQDLELKLTKAELPENVQKVVKKELKRIKKMSPQSPEYPMLRHYLELIADLPWNKSTKDNIDISKAREDLDQDHYAMDEVKKRILEYLAVRQLKNSLRGPILCFVGPPGVGKTSIGKSIANTLGRKFHRISLGGVSDQSDIRGHRRTYIGSMPGRLIQGLKTVGVNNPVFLLDELDKMSSGVHGDPAAAMLEVLDPEQNCNFVDHYLNVPFDLSQIIFIATANDLKTIARPLRDRMEIIQIPGYTFEDKLPIGKIHLLPKQIKMHGINSDILQVTDEALKFIISNYTREAGVRELERKFGALCRAVAVRVAEKEKGSNGTESSTVTNMRMREDDREKATISSQPPMMPIVLDEAAIEDILGHPIYERSQTSGLGQIGVAVGLAWTSVGGEVMVVEAIKMMKRGEKGELVLTGQLGDVMKESANLALSWIRSNAKKLRIDSDASLMNNVDVHIHFPEGAISKDGPSAGVTITTALVSLFTEKTAIQELAMTGEITLRGLVLPVGGIKEKVIAAYRSGFRKVLIPYQNKKDLRNLPGHVREGLDIIPVKTIEEVIEHSFEETLMANFDELALDTLSKL